MPSPLDPIRPVFRFLRQRGLDIQSPTRRDAANAMTVQRRLFRGEAVSTILDCGAHRGRVAREYADAFASATIHAFEPTPATFEALRRNVASQPRIRPVNAAVGDRSGTLDLYIAPFEQANSLLPRHPGKPEAETAVKARVVRLDEYCREQGLERVEILKLDVEGFELPAIKGCGSMIDELKIDVLYCETRFDSGGGMNTTLPDLCNHLLPRGYEFFGFYDPRYTPELQLDWLDVLFVSVPRLARHRRG